MKYTGVGIWNVHDKRGRVRPHKDWVIVDKAHAAILTPDEAKAILEVRRSLTNKAFYQPKGRSQKTEYLLSGGLFKCECGKNMARLRTQSGRYYVCGERLYRKGLECGQGVYVPQDQIEREVLEGLREILGHCADPKGFARMVNEEIKRLWEMQYGRASNAKSQLAAIEKRIANVRKAIEEGLEETVWANDRLRELSVERQRIEAQTTASEPPPVISVEEAVAYRRKVEKIFSVGTMGERKRLLGTWIAEMKLAPERREVSITYRVPEPIVMVHVVAGALYDAMHNMLAPRLVRRFRLVRKGGRRQTLEPYDDAPNLARDGRSPHFASPNTKAQESGPQDEILGAVSSSGS